MVALFFAATLLGGCGGDDSSVAVGVLPQEIQYENLNGQVGGVILGPGLSITQTDAATCISWCLSSLTVLGSQEQFQAFVVQSPGVEESKPRVLMAGGAIDFSRKQIWALKLGYSFPADVALSIRELQESIEIQPIICNPVIVGSGMAYLSNIFVVLSRDMLNKPVVFIDHGPVRHGPECPFAEMVVRS